MALSATEYLNGVLRTANLTLSTEQQIDNCLISIQGEWGEVANYVKKTLYHGKAFDPEILVNELGDALFYIFWLNRAINPEFTGESFNHMFKSQFSQYLGQYREDLTCAEHAYQVITSLSILNTRAISVMRNFQLGNTVSSTFCEQIEISSQSLLKTLALFSLSCSLGCSYGFIAQKNIEKLLKRYPKGFSHQASENREV